MTARKSPTNSPIVVKNDDDLKLVLKPVVDKVFQLIRIHADKGYDGYKSLGQLFVVVDHSPRYNYEPLSEIIAELMNEVDPYDMKGLVFDELLFDINRPTWLFEHTSRFIDTDGDVDDMGPHHDNEVVDSFRLAIDIDQVSGFLAQIVFMRALVDKLSNDNTVEDFTIDKPAWSQVEGDTDLEDILLGNIHSAVRMFNREVKFLACNGDSINLVLHPAA